MMVSPRGFGKEGGGGDAAAGLGRMKADKSAEANLQMREAILRDAFKRAMGRGISFAADCHRCNNE